MPKIPQTLLELGDTLSADGAVRSKYGFADPISEDEEKECFFRTVLSGAGGATLVFASEYLVKTALRRSTYIKIDATFKVVPRLPKAHQLLTIHAKLGGRAFPVVYALMSSRRKTAYVQLFEYLKLVLCPSWIPENVMMDFEKAMRGAFQEVFPSVHIGGCYFHYAQALQRRWAHLGLDCLTGAVNRASAKDLKESLMALPFAPAQHILTVYEEMEDNVPLIVRAKAAEMLLYMRRFWIPRREEMSVYDLPDRKNNDTESFHSGLLRKVGKVHPGIWNFLSFLISIHVEARISFRRYDLHGLHDTTATPRRCLWTEQRIQHAKNTLEAGQMTVLEFVRWCRHSVRETTYLVRHARSLRRHWRAEEFEVHFSDVETSSEDDNDDTSSFGDSDLDGENVQTEADEMDVQGFDVLEVDMDGVQYPASPENMIDADDEHIYDDDDDEMWHVPEAHETMLLEQIIAPVEDLGVPHVAVPSGDELNLPARGPGTFSICLESPSCVVLHPCNMLCICKDCTEGIVVCPVCRTPVEGMTNVIVS